MGRRNVVDHGLGTAFLCYRLQIGEVTPKGNVPSFSNTQMHHEIAQSSSVNLESETLQLGSGGYKVVYMVLQFC